MKPAVTTLCTLAAAAALSAPTSARAQGDIFLCVDDQGRKTYQNTGSMRGCRRMEVRPLMTVPAPRMPAGAAQPQRLAEVQATPVNFPRVDGESQRVRDGERRRILLDELKAEEDRLARLRQDYNDGAPEQQGDEARNPARYQERVQRLQEDITRSESNLAALRRELALVR